MSNPNTKNTTALPDISLPEQRYQNAKIFLERSSLKKLLFLYHYALKELVGSDTALRDRPKHSYIENDNDFMALAIFYNRFDQNYDADLKDELVHALAAEALRSETSYHTLKKLSEDDSVQISCASHDATEEKTTVGEFTHDPKPWKAPRLTH